MANQTITTNTNFDALTGLLAGETVTINSGATLVIDSDPQLNRVLAGNITINDGVCFVDGTKVRELNFSGASSLPVIGDTLTAGSVAGQVIGVTGNTTAGTIRLRSLNGAISNGAALSFTGGKTATAASADRVGWLQVLFTETRNITGGRLTEFRAIGNPDRYLIGISNGTASQTFLHYCATPTGALWVETGLGTGVYEIWQNLGSLFPSEAGTGIRGNFFGQPGATITFGNGTNGNIPPNGARIYAPNLTIGTATTAAPTTPTTQNTATALCIATNYNVVAEDVNIAGFQFSSIANFSFKKTFLHPCNFSISVTPTPGTLDNVGSGIVAGYAMRNITANNSQIEITNSSLLSWRESNVFSLSAGTLKVEDCKLFQVARTTAPNCSTSALTSVEITEILLAGGGATFNSSRNIKIKNIRISDAINTTVNNVSNAVWGLRFAGSCSDIFIDGVIVDGARPYLGVISAADSIRCKVRNVGTVAAPIDLQSHSAVLFQGEGLTRDTDLARVYFSNPRSASGVSFGIFAVGNLIQNMSVFSVSGLLTSIGYNAISRGIRGNTVSSSPNDGTIFFDRFASDTSGFLGINGTTQTMGQNYYEIIGLARYSGTAVSLRAIGDQIIYTWPWFVLGHTGFSNSAFTFSGTNQGNHSYEYRLDTGSGFSGAWKTLSGANLSAETISPATGFRIQVRITCITANTSNAITSILIPTTTTATDQLTLYPIDQVEATLSFTGLIPGSEIRIFRNSDSAELAGVESSGTTFSYTYTHEGTDTAVSVNIIKPGYVYQTIPLSLTASSNSLPIQQRVDYSYA